MNYEEYCSAFREGVYVSQVLLEEYMPVSEFGNKWTSGKWDDVRSRLAHRQNEYEKFGKAGDVYAQHRAATMARSVDRAQRYLDRQERKEHRRFIDSLARGGNGFDDSTR